MASTPYTNKDFSDSRLKTNFAAISTPIAKVQALQGLTYNGLIPAGSDIEIDTTTPQVGLIAQAVQGVLPQAVIRADFDEEYNIDGTTYSISGDNYLTVDYGRVVPLLVEAIKAQQVLIAAGIGTQGIQGVQGLTGIQGAQGLQGAQGTQGLQGIIGAQGLTGIQGAQGLQGAQGTQGLQGIQGIQGIQGTQGAQGLQGTQGTQGIQGIQGVQGTQGTQGLQGIQGIQGITGIQGAQGLQGAQGTQGLQGTQGTQGIQGLKGTEITISDTAPSSPSINDLWWNSVGGMLMIYYYDGDTSQWVSATAGITGSQGTQGLQGIQGIQGITGVQGITGIQGTQGTQGQQGITGSQGTQGTQGIQGITGSQGTQGTQGQQGIQGTQGTQGIQGTQGTQGLQGIQGIQGLQGITGTQGTQGIQGITGLAFTIAKTYVSVAALTADTSPSAIVAGQFALINTSDVQNSENSRLYIWDGAAYIFVDDLSGTAGIQGITGSTGAQGTQGIQGIQGVQGITGSQGTIGTSVTGAQGIQGITGATGAQGTQGTQGIQGLQGITGAQGTVGTTGAQGTLGTQGITGTTGAQGITGTTGAQGTVGTQGTIGTSVTGAQGTQGTSGASILGTTNTFSGSNSFTSTIIGKNGSTADINGANDTGSFSCRGDATYPASMSFHRSGVYAINAGLSTGNNFVIGGWSAATNAFSMTGSGSLTLAADVRAPLFYDTNDTAYYTDPASTSRLSTLRVVGNELYLSGGSPTMHFVDSDERGCALHNNSNLFYILSSNGTGGESWSQNSGQWPFYINLNNNNAVFGGDIYAVGNVTAYSDIKLKENIVSVENGLGKVLAMRGVYYNMKSDSTKRKRIGVIAQEIQKILPEVVKLNQDPKEDPEGTLTVDYGNITAILIEAIKEQQSQIEELKLLVQSIAHK